MPIIATIMQPLLDLIDSGGPVFIILLLTSSLTLTLVCYKVLQYSNAQVGKLAPLKTALAALDLGERQEAAHIFDQSKHFLAPVYRLGLSLPHEESVTERLEAEAEVAFMPLEKGFRALDTVAQLAPLLGLLGTVLGMIEAFQQLQSAGPQVDPSALAGGIWVALLTTAAGLIVAMPTSVALTWFEARIDEERLFASHVFAVLNTPAAKNTVPAADEREAA